MMEEVSHESRDGTLTPPPKSGAPPPTSNPLQTGLTPPPQGPYHAAPPQTYTSSQLPTSYSPQVSSYRPPVTGPNVQSPTQSAYSPSQLPTSYSPQDVSTSSYQPPVTGPSVPSPIQSAGDSTITLPDVPDYNAGQERQSFSGSGGMWGWIKSASHNTFVQSVMEKTKTGVDRMITTLDPGMTPYLRQGGDISVIVASEKEVKWGAVRDAFQKVFGLADVRGMSAQSGVAPQPVGYAAGLRGAQDRISYLRRSGLIHEKQLCVAIESFIAELLPDKWFDIGCVILEDPVHNINLEMFTQAVPVPFEIVSHIQSATPSDYSLSWSGLSVTIGQALQHHMAWIEPTDWHKTLTGQSRKAIIHDTVVTLAGLYREKLPKSAPGRPI